ncbi:MAG: DUF1152 domain-containing protein, partial [Pseudomonadota bacterium]
DFEQLYRLGDLSQRKIGFIGIGGGSDGIQASMISKMLQSENRKPTFVISVRTALTMSGEPRVIEDHGGEIYPGVYKIEPHTKGPRHQRFLENLPADEVPVYVVLDSLDGKLSQQIDAVIGHSGGVGHLVAVDTGGDSLYPNTDMAISRATPDQDLRVLSALPELNMPVSTAIVAAGVDSPMNASEILRQAGAKYYDPTDTEALQVLSFYRQHRMDGSHQSRFGKTTLAWQAALSGTEGLQALPLPQRVVLSNRNPWNPYVHIEESMRGIFFMDLEDHLKAIGVSINSNFKLTSSQRERFERSTYMHLLQNFFKSTMDWNMNRNRSASIVKFSNPKDPNQYVVMKFTDIAESSSRLSADELVALESALAAGEPFVFQEVEQIFADSFTITQKDIDEIVAGETNLHQLLKYKGWTIKTIKEGWVYEYGDAWYRAGWIHRYTSPDGRFELTETTDFTPHSRAELNQIFEAMQSSGQFRTDRAVAAFDSEDGVIPGVNPRASAPR